jgi:hypothetical protein
MKGDEFESEGSPKRNNKSVNDSSPFNFLTDDKDESNSQGDKSETAELEIEKV